MSTPSLSVAERGVVVSSFDATKSSRQRFFSRSPSKATLSIRQSVKRKGMYDMAAPLGFFMLLLVFAMVLVLMKLKGLEDARPQLQEDLDAQKADAMLISIMRSNMPLDYGAGKQAPLADIVIINNDGRYDEVIGSVLTKSLNASNYFDMTIYYPSGKVLYSNSKDFNKMVAADIIIKSVAYAKLPSSTQLIEIELTTYTRRAGDYPIPRMMEWSRSGTGLSIEENKEAAVVAAKEKATTAETLDRINSHH